ncbi:MAG: P-loop NTPase fold protein [Planctomycetaceae bacterium]
MDSRISYLGTVWNTFFAFWCSLIAILWLVAEGLFTGKLFVRLSWWCALAGEHVSKTLNWWFGAVENLIWLVLFTATCMLLKGDVWFVEGTMEQRATLFISMVSVWLAMHLFLYSRFGATAAARYGDRAEESFDEHPTARLLPSQRHAFNELRHRIRFVEKDSSAVVIALEGGWGAGKSFVIEALQRNYCPAMLRAVHAFHQRLSSIPPALPWQAGANAIWETLRCYLDPERCHELWEALPQDAEQPSKASRDAFNPDAAPEPSTPKRDATQTIFLNIDAWRFSSEADLHWHVFETILSHPESPAPWRFLGVNFTNFFRYPLLTVPVFAMRTFQLMFTRGQMQLPGGVSFSVSLSGMLWERQLEWVLHGLRKRGYRVVWCFDEIDRSTPEIAQAALTLSRRFLSFPGTVVIVPHVRSQLRFKVFNPASITRPDLESSMMGVLWEHYGPRLDIQAIDQIAPSPRASNWTPGKTFPAGDTNRTMELWKSLTAEEPSGTISRRIKAELIRQYLKGNKPQQEYFAFLFEEKFLHQAHVELSRLTGPDVAEMATKFDELKDLMRKYLVLNPQGSLIGGTPVSVDEQLNQFREKLPHVIFGAYRQFGWSPTTRPVLRHMAEELHQKLFALANATDTAAYRNLWKAVVDALKNVTFRPTSATLNVRILILIVLIAYRRASKRLPPDLRAT